MAQYLPVLEWDALVESLIVHYGFHNLKLPDGSKYGLDGTVDSWKRLICQLCKRESNFKPATTYAEGGHLAGQLSTGLFQLSYSSTRSYARFAKDETTRKLLTSVTTESLKIPATNIVAAFVIFNRWLTTDKVVARKESSGWKGLARYHSPFRKSDFAPQVIARKPIATKETPMSEIKVPKEVAMAFAKRQELKSTCNNIFEVDYSINSKFPRLFVYRIKEKKLYKYKTAHGVGGKNRTPNNGVCREVSNASGSLMSSLGYIKTGPKYQSDSVGTAVRLNGLSPTNSKILARGVVLHGSSYVYDNEGNTDTSVCGRSYGCIATDDKYISKTGGGELIEWLRDGSIGVTHYAGAFKIG